MCDEVNSVYICRASTFLMLCVSLTQSWLLWEAVGLGRAERRARSGCSPLDGCFGMCQGIMSCTAKAGANAAADLAGESRRSGVTTACKQGLDLREE